MQSKTIFNNLYTSKYFKDLPDFRAKRTQAFITIALTLITIAFFGIFAINPTISTIANLQKQKEDNTFVEQSLDQKIVNLNTLTQVYQSIQPDITYVYNAIPQTPQIPELVGQLKVLGEDNNVAMKRLQVQEVDLTKTTEGAQGFSTFKLSLEAEGTYANLFAYMNAVTNFQRIITIDSISLNKGTDDDSQIKLNIQATAFFKK